MVNVKNNVGVTTSVHNMARLNVLYMVIYEMAEQFGVNAQALKTIRKGILEKQYINKFVIEYYNEKKEIVGEVFFTIDWDKYKINASNAEGANISLDASKSVHSQISEMSDVIIEYVNKMRKDFNVCEISTSYWLKTDSELIKSGYNTTYKEARNELGLCENKTTNKYNISPSFEKTFAFLFERLDELFIEFRRN